MITDIKYCIPTYRRKQIKTLDVYSDCVLFADREDASFLAGKYDQPVVVLPDGVQGNIARVRNWILYWAKTNAEAVVLLDDDLAGIYWFEPQEEAGRTKAVKLNTEQIRTVMLDAANMCNDMGYKQFGFQPTYNPLLYKVGTPLKIRQYCPSPVSGFISDCCCRYDERLFLKEDYDITLQNIALYGGNLRLEYIAFSCDQDCKGDHTGGGCSSVRTSKTEQEQLTLLQKKWGSDLVKIKDGDINPVLRIGKRG